MACGVALKRPFSFEAYSNPDDGNDAKRRCTKMGCLPFRPSLGTLAASLPNASSAPTSGILSPTKEALSKNISPFAAAASHIQLSPCQLQSYLKAEVRSLKRRRLFPKRLFVECTSSENDFATFAGHDSESVSSFLQPSTKRNCRMANEYRTAPNSPTANSSSDSDSETRMTLTPLNKRSDSHLSLFDRPQFSLKQVQLVCERLLKQQEIRICFEYDTKLKKLLEEQKEQFVQFTREQEKEQFRANGEEFSYYS